LNKLTNIEGISNRYNDANKRENWMVQSFPDISVNYTPEFRHENVAYKIRYSY